MKAMFARNVLPLARERSAGAAIVSCTLHTFGLGESWVAEKLGDLMSRGRNPSVGTTVSGGIVSLRVNSRFESRDRALEELEHTVAACRAALGNIIYGADDETLPDLVGELMRQARKTVATAESCTGGLIAKMLTDIAGSSAYFTQGWVTYSNAAKSRELHVDPNTLAAKGAVSIEVAEQMAAGALRESGADIAVSVTGIAGPDGGTVDKPVGTVCLGLASRDGGDVRVTSRVFNFPGDREMIRDRSAKMALSMLRYELIGAEMPF
jgi:nicotinamide-nucleotide amidase